MNSKVYDIAAVIGFILCFVLCLIFVPDIGFFKFLGIVVGSFIAGLVCFEFTYLCTFKFLESTNPSEWEFAVLEKWFENGTTKYYPVVKTVKFGYFVNIDKTFISSVSSGTEYDTYEEAEEVIKDYKALEIEQYKEEVKNVKSGKRCRKPKCLRKKYHKI